MAGTCSVSAESVRVGIYRDVSGLYGDTADRDRNFDLLFLKRLAAETGWTYCYFPGTYRKCLENLDHGVVDMVLGIPYTGEYTDRFLYTKFGYHTCFTMLLARLDNSQFYAGDVDRLDGASVGIVGDDPCRIEKLKEFESEKGIRLNLKFYGSREALDRDFISGAVALECVPVSKLRTGEKAVWNLGAYPLYIVTAASQRPFYRQLDMAVTAVYSHQYFSVTHDQLETSDYRLLSSPNMTKQEHDFISRAPVIYVPQYLNMGCLWAYIHKLVNLNFVPDSKIPYDRSPYISRIEMVPYLGTGDAAETAEYTQPVCTIVQWVITAPGIVPESVLRGREQNISGKKLAVAIEKHLTDIVPYYKDKLEPFQIVQYDSISDCLDAVADRQCDATFIPDYLLAAGYSLGDYPELRNSKFLRYEVPYRMRVTEKTGLLAPILDKALNQIPEDFYTRQIQEFAQMMPYHPGRTVVNRRRWQLAEIAVGLAVVFWIFFRIRKEYYFRKWAFTDDLTGLWNGRRFEIEADKILRKDRDANYAIIDSDIRGFKYINQSYGIDYGDRLLRFYAESLRKYQPSDTFIARGYADRFYILFPVESLGDCSYKCVQLFTWCNSEAASNGYHYIIKDGVALTGKDFGYDTVRNLIGKASYAKYTIKQDMVNSIALFDEKMKRQMNFSQRIESCMDKAFENEEFFIVYQPQIDLHDGTIAGTEALVRWQSPENGLLAPDEFLPILEKNGYIIKLDFYVYRKVFDFMQHMLDMGAMMVPVSVNMSRFHLNAPDFIREFEYLFSQYRIPPSFVEVEVIERASGQKDTMLMNVTKQLQKAGFRVAMDDFGSGESSLNMLHTIPVDILKLDRNFLYRAENSTDSKVIITKVMEMARGLGKVTVCEGVETREQVEFLKTVGCDMAQGVYYSKPLSENDFREYLEQSIRHVDRPT